MGTTALEQALRTADPSMMGDTQVDMLGFGYFETLGLHYPNPAPAIVLMRRKVYPGAVQDWHVCGWTGVAGTTIVNGDSFAHGASTGWEYAAAHIFGNGFIGPFSEPTRLDIDSGGDAISPALPTWPRNVKAVARVAGSYAISWRYETWGQGAAPTDFVVFEGSTIATIDYDTIIGTVVYDAAVQRQSHTETGFTDGTDHAFAVRARNSGGVQEKNELTTSVVGAEDGEPPAASILAAGLRGPGG